LLQKHLLMESQLSALGTRIRNLNKRAQPYMKSLQPETQLLQKQLEPLNKDYEKFVTLSFDLLTPEVNRSCPCPRGKDLCQFPLKAVYLFSK